MAKADRKIIMTNQKIILTGITPSGSGEVHIGNYYGCVKQILELQKAADKVYFFIADLHALTTVQNKSQLQHNIENLVLAYLAFGINTDKVVFYRQSDIPEVSFLQTILNNVTPLGLIKRAHAYKDKLQKGQTESDINMGLFNYPVLMAADILLYNPDLVPVGQDQKQHLEIARDVASRFNKIYGPVFKLPEFYTKKETAAILGTEGKRKMSKSLGNYIGIFEDEKIIRKQVMSCFTDPLRIHPTDPGHLEGNMAFFYHDLVNDNKAEVASLKDRYVKGKVSDLEVKEKLFMALMKKFAPVRERYQELKNQSSIVRDILKNGKKEAEIGAKETIKKVKEAVGLKNLYSID